MKTAEIYPVPAGESPGYAWKWRATGQKVTAENTFRFYFDCVTDAREHGYTVELTYAHGETAPGGAAYVLRDAGS